MFPLWIVALFVVALSARVSRVDALRFWGHAAGLFSDAPILFFAFGSVGYVQTAVVLLYIINFYGMIKFGLKLN